MKFNKLLVKILAEDGEDYGYAIKFSNGLNIVRGDNSSGKSTFVNSLIYALGMEEIIGSKGNSSLPYALKDKFELDLYEKKVTQSVVYLEIENREGIVITLKRSIKSADVDNKLVQIIDGPYLTGDMHEKLKTCFTFLHDAGSAQDAKQGFFAYLENFLKLDLPQITDGRGKETKLYLQSIFSAFIVEQKRGWTDYIANIPYYGVSGMREKVASFLIDLDVFRNSKKLNELHVSRNKIMSDWSEIATSIKLTADNKNLSVAGVSKSPVIDFDQNLVKLGERTGVDIKPLFEVRADLLKDIEKISKKQTPEKEENSPELVKTIEKIQNRIDELLLMQSMCSSQVKINQSQLKQYKVNLDSVEADLKSNKLTLKLVNFGANEADLNVAKGTCPTCLQPVDDILISPDSISMPMDLEENVVHLNNQKKMIKALIEGLNKNIERDKGQLVNINREMSTLRQELISHKRDIKSTSDIKEAELRKKINIENRLSDISFAEEKIESYLFTLLRLSSDYKDVNSTISKLSKASFSTDDWNKINSFSREFRSLASSFGYRSAKVDEIQIKPETLLPYLQDIELRQTVETPTEKGKKTSSSADIKSDSSASDFVRLIWSYLISLYTTSVAHCGNHPGFLLFDEPAQHSMSTKSVNAMLSKLAETKGLQSIIAASFDESDDNYKDSTLGISQFTLERLPRKLISRLKNNTDKK